MTKDMDPSFEDYVRGRQRQLVRAAYLMCGSETQAQDLVQEALVKLAARWDSVRTENPDAYVRRILYHDAISAWRRTRHESLTDLVPHRPVSCCAISRTAPRPTRRRSWGYRSVPSRARPMMAWRACA